MCMTRPECQNCETCGRRKYQLWMGPEMHERGCPFGYQTMLDCPDTRNRARLIVWARENGVAVAEAGIALVDQMIAAGFDPSTPPEELEQERG